MSVLNKSTRWELDVIHDDEFYGEDGEQLDAQTLEGTDAEYPLSWLVIGVTVSFELPDHRKDVIIAHYKHKLRKVGQ